MSAPVVTASETSDAQEIADLLTAHRIKRVPVVRNGKVVGIVSRADLVRALASVGLGPAGDLHRSNPITDLFDKIDQRFNHLQSRSGYSAAAPGAAATLTGRGETPADASEFRKLVAEFETEEARKREDERFAKSRLHSEQMKVLIGEHITQKRWRDLLRRARESAAHGMKEFLLLRFPHDLCSDGGRAINALAGNGNWPETLRGEAAELYLRWKQDLRPHGFRLAARVLDFPGGVPGDIGLFLEWGQ